MIRRRESSAVTDAEMTSRIRAALERRSTKTASTIAIERPDGEDPRKATTAPAAESASMPGSTDPESRMPLEPSTNSSRATRNARASSPKPTATRPEKTIVIQAAAVTVPGRRSPRPRLAVCGCRCAVLRLLAVGLLVVLRLLAVGLARRRRAVGAVLPRGVGLPGRLAVGRVRRAGLLVAHAAILITPGNGPADEASARLEREPATYLDPPQADDRRHAPPSPGRRRGGSRARRTGSPRR